MQRRNDQGKPAAHQIPAKTFVLGKHGGLVYSGNQDVPNWRYHPTKGWRKV